MFKLLKSKVLNFCHVLSFELYSNFTFFLKDSINGDQIKQKENRNIFGLNSEYINNFKVKNFCGNLTAGINIRHDESKNNELSHTLNLSVTLSPIQLGNVTETNLGLYASTTFEIGKLSFNPSIRFDYFNFQYNDALQSKYETQTVSTAIISPKFNLLYNYSNHLQLYLKSGRGFHSNDARVVVAKNGTKILPAAYGVDGGFIWKPTTNLFLNIAYWYLFLEQEFVYVGDEGIVEPSDKTQRQGVDFSLRYQPLNWLFLNFDANYNQAKYVEALEGQNYIPLAPNFTCVGALNVLHNSGLYGGLHFRFLNDRPANEDNSIIAKGYAITDFNAGYKWQKTSFELQIQNLFNTRWNETQFATTSKLLNESTAVEEIHFTPGTPFFIKGILKFSI